MRIATHSEKGIIIIGCYDNVNIGFYGLDLSRKTGMSLRYKRFCNSYKNCEDGCGLWSWHRTGLELDIDSNSWS